MQRDVKDEQLPSDAGTAAEVTPLLAASTIVLRERSFEVLLMHRHERSSFVPGVWVFPGGSIDDRDRTIAQELASGDELLTTMRVCAARELLEESGIWLGAPRSDVPELRRQLNAGENRASADDFRGIDEKLVWTARWITPVGVPKRFDTYFFITSVNDDMTATADDVEGVEIVWLTPDEALQRHAAGSLPLVFPTIRNLEALRGFGSVDELIASRRGATIPTILPVIVSEGGKKKIVTPDEP